MASLDTTLTSGILLQSGIRTFCVKALLLTPCAQGADDATNCVLPSVREHVRGRADVVLSKGQVFLARLSQAPLRLGAGQGVDKGSPEAAIPAVFGSSES